jgi:tetratricopeptide (TPR) repeat protein
MFETALQRIQSRFEQACDEARAGQLLAAAPKLAECVAVEPGNADFVDAWLEVLQALPPADREERASAFAMLARLGHDEHWDEVLQKGWLLLRDFPRRVGLLQTLATATASLGHFEAADCYLAAALKIAPDQPDVLRQRAKLLAQLRRYEDALQTWITLERVSPDDPGAAGAIASLTIERSRRRNGLKRRSEDYRSIEPKARTRSLLTAAAPAKVYGSLSSPPVTNASLHRTQIQELELATREFPSHADNYLQLAPLYLEKDRDQDAERMLNRGRAATNYDPRVVALWEEIAVKCMETRVTLARRDAAEHPSAHTQSMVAQILRERDRLETAVFTSRAAREPENLALQYELGLRLKRAAKLPEAMKHLDRALGDPIERACAAYELGECQLQNGNVAEAMRYYRLAAETALAEQAACRKAALYQLGSLAGQMKLNRDAARYLRELVRIDPKYRDAVQLLQNVAPAEPAAKNAAAASECRARSSSPAA